MKFVRWLEKSFFFLEWKLWLNQKIKKDLIKYNILFVEKTNTQLSSNTIKLEHETEDELMNICYFLIY